MEFSKHKSIYIQIADHFYERVLKRVWVPGEKVPSIRQLAVEMEVNPNTVMRSYTTLEEKGILYNQRGIGFFVTDEAPALVSDLLRERFLNEQLPEVFETMDLLGLPPADLISLYERWKSSSKTQTKHNT